MRLKTIVDEDFVNYKEPVMYIGTAVCGGKCFKEAGLPPSMCQNDAWRRVPDKIINDEDIVRRYLSNDITKGICFAGLEPMEQILEMLNIISALRIKYHCNDTVIIYTGYDKDEVLPQIEALQEYENIIVKFGRYIPNFTPHYDEVLGVCLASDNQYAEKIS